MNRSCVILMTGGLIASLPGCLPDKPNDALRKGPDEVCTRQSECDAGLVCSSAGRCAEVGAAGTSGSERACSDSSDCRLGLFCSSLDICVRPGVGELNAPCAGAESCRLDLICAAHGACATPGSDGTATVGGGCETDVDCAFGLTCALSSVCARTSAWPGADCVLPDEIGGPPRLLFEVPRLGASSDFFRLPFPNDIRRRDGVIDLNGFPAPTLSGSAESLDVVGRFASAMVADSRAFGLNPSIVFRFNTNVDFNTLDFGGDGATLLFVNITPGEDNPNKGRRPRSRYFSTTRRSKYVCHNWLGIRPSEGSPLQPNNVYAVLFMRGTADADGNLLVPDADFAEVIGETEPAHPALKAAWRAYAPLRQWMVEESILTREVVGGTVFTTGDPGLRVTNIRTAAHAVDVEPASLVTVCDGRKPSPCHGDAGRVCGDPNEAFVEIHAKISMPVFQRGIVPHASPGGGEIPTIDGLPYSQVRFETCAALAVPLGDPPAGGWPVVLFAHADGGSFRSFVVDGVAARLARLGFAVLGYDGVLQGPRDGGGVADGARAVGGLYDLGNPAGMRDSLLQGAADLFYLTRFVRAFEPQSVTDSRGEAYRLAFDADRISFFGHGLGGRVGTLFVAHEPDVEAAVLASTGGAWTEILLNQKQPVDFAAELKLALADTELNGLHPALGLMQSYLDASDPVNYGHLLRTPLSAEAAKHVFVVYGVGDEFTPSSAMKALAIAARLPRVGAELESLESVPEAGSDRVAGNIDISGQAITQGLVQYQAGVEGEGHRVAFVQSQAVADVDHFFRTLLISADGVPEIGATGEQALDGP